MFHCSWLQGRPCDNPLAPVTVAFAEQVRGLCVCVGVTRHHHRAQSSGFSLIYSGCHDSDRQLPPSLPEAVCVFLCLCSKAAVCLVNSNLETVAGAIYKSAPLVGHLSSEVRNRRCTLPGFFCSLTHRSYRFHPATGCTFAPRDRRAMPLSVTGTRKTTAWSFQLFSLLFI